MRFLKTKSEKYEERRRGQFFLEAGLEEHTGGAIMQC
jgi:hypothetical protein